MQSELAVPMIARGKLVGVIDVQSTRLNAYSEHDRALLRLIASRVAVSIDNARLYRRVERQNRTLRDAGAPLAGVLLDPRSRRAARQDRQDHARADQLRRFQHPAGGSTSERACATASACATTSASTSTTFRWARASPARPPKSREPIRVNDTIADPRYIASHPDIRSEVAVPLIVQDRVIGVMDLESERVGYFTEDHVRTLSLLAPQIASSVENARLYEELSHARAAHGAGSEGRAQAAGDAAAAQGSRDRGLEIAIAAAAGARDQRRRVRLLRARRRVTRSSRSATSSGKGAAAALYGALVSGLLRLARPAARGPAELMQSLNEALLERKVDAQYVTLLVHAVADRTTASSAMANAGADAADDLPQRRDRQDSRSKAFRSGLLEDREYDEVVFMTQPGDTIVLYSDGIEDQLNPANEEYGRGRISSTAQETLRSDSRRRSWTQSSRRSTRTSTMRPLPTTRR